MYVKKLIHPEYFQGNKKKDKYFEGWYYKLVSADEHTTLAFIPGISKHQKDPHAFIQVFISEHREGQTKLATYYFRYTIDQFRFGHDQFFVQIADNTFSLDKITIKLKNQKIDLSGTLILSNLTPIERTLFTPNIMGFFGYFNFMECYHGIVSMTHQLDGSLKLNQSILTFDHGKGYIEKDWGRSFPRAYVWLQSNHFNDDKTSFMFSYADIPFLGFYFKGLIANLYYQGREYRFATYNGAKVVLEQVEPKTVHYIIKKGRYLLDIQASSQTEIALASPKDGAMINQIKEGLSGQITIKLYQRGSLIYEDTGHHAGIEIMKSLQSS